MATLTIRVSLLLALIGLVACSDATRRPADGDGDGDGDGDIDPCPPPEVCPHPGFDAEWEIDVGAEVADVTDVQVVLLGDDGLPLTLSTCELSMSSVLSPGDRVHALNVHSEGWGDCWLSQLWRGDELIALVANCEAEGEVTPPLDDLGWTISLSLDCEGSVDQVCTAAGAPIHLVLPERTFTADVTVPSGARETLTAGIPATVSGWQVLLVDARVTDAVEEGYCFEPAHGGFLMAATATTATASCPEPPVVVRGSLGLNISASRTAREFIVDEVTPDSLLLLDAEGHETRFGWYGPDPSLAVPVGAVVMARRYDWDETRGGFLDVIELAGRVALATISNDNFMLELPTLEAIGLDLELGEPCFFDQGVLECTGETLVAQRYPLILTTETGESVEVELGQTGEVGSWVVTPVEASQYPGAGCPDGPHVEAWGPFGLTLMQGLQRDD